MRSRLLTKYSFFILALILVVGTVLSVVYLVHFQGSAKRIIASSNNELRDNGINLIKEKGHSMVRMMSQNLATPLYNYDGDRILEIMRLARKQRFVEYAYLLDSNGRVINDGIPETPDLNKQFTDEMGKRAAVADDLLTQLNRKFVDISIPVNYTDGTKLGGIRVGFDLTELNFLIQENSFRLDSIRIDQTQSKILLVMGAILALFPFGFWMATIMSRNMAQPLVELNDMVGKVATGDYDVHTDIDRSDEIGDLAKSLGRMVDGFKKQTVTREYVSHVIDQVMDMVLVVSPEGLIQSVNKATCETLEYHPQDLMGQPFSTLLGDESFKQRWLKMLREKGSITNLETRYITKEKVNIPVHFTSSFLQASLVESQSIVCVAKDITELKKTKKFSAIGQLASSVAHELRNPLGAIKNAIYYFKEVLKGTKILEDDPSLGEFLDLSDKEIKRSNRMVGELLDYSRDVKLSTQPTDINDLVEGVHQSIEIPNGITWNQVSFDKNLPIAMVDPQKLEQVFINLTSNAFQAMTAGGKLDVEVMVEKDFESNQDVMVINFSDTGVGMSEEKIRHIFEPLYTTRNTGTGLGLAICQEIVQAHGGKIEVVSQPGSGTTFSVIFPLIRAAA